MVVKQTPGRPAKKTVRRPDSPAPVDERPVDGFQRQPKVYTLEFTGEFEGMRVSFRPLAYGHVLDDSLTMDWARPNVPKDEWTAGLRAVSEAAASVLIEWNVLDEQGHRVPATREGLASLDQDQAIAIVMTWAFRVIGVSAPLDEPSDSGATSEEASIPMETQSSSLAS